MKRKRGQAEVVGLMVIVVLLIFIGVIFLRFYLAKPAASYSDARSSLEASNVLNAVINMHIKGKAFVDYVEECNYDVDACNKLEDEIKAVLSHVLKKGRKYSFSIYSEGRELIKIDDCDIGVSSSYMVAENNVFYDVNLKIC